jgi:ATP-dependent Lhr-like helicase
MDLPVRIETRTGDTPQSKRARQRTDPPDILLTTPEQVSLLIANAACRTAVFKCLRYVIFRRVAFADRSSKRGHLLWHWRLRDCGSLAPGLRNNRPVRHGGRSRRAAALAGATNRLARKIMPDWIKVEGGASPIITILQSDDRIPWSGHSARYAIPGCLRDHQEITVQR